MCSFPAAYSVISSAGGSVAQGEAAAQEAPGLRCSAGPERQAWHRNLCGGCISPSPWLGCCGVAGAVWCGAHWHPVSLKSYPESTGMGLWAGGHEPVASPLSASPACCLRTRSPGGRGQAAWTRLSRVPLGGIGEKGLQSGKVLKGLSDPPAVGWGQHCPIWEPRLARSRGSRGIV